MKERIIAIVILILAAITVWAIATELPKKEYAQPASDFSKAVREGNTPVTPAVSREVIRLHILADSDSDRDQTIKLALRDILLPYLTAATLDASSKEEALAQLKEQCPSLTDIANTALAGFGVDYTATVSVEHLYFPIRIYGSQTYLSEDAVIFPPGFYDSVQVVLGSGEGHNWWCLTYPTLCFIDSTYDYVPKDSDLYKVKIGTLKNSPLKDLFFEEDTEIYFGSKLWELFKKLFSDVFSDKI